MKVFKSIFILFEWMFLALIVVELLSFTIITVSNYVLYGEAREGSRAFYDPYTLFLQNPAIRPTIGSKSSTDTSDSYVIWIFGGSTIRGATNHDDRTIPSFLAQTMNNDRTDRKYSVVNFGINSFNSLLESKYLQKALIEIRPLPDLVIFYDGANDIKYFLEHRDVYGHHGYRRVKALIESYHFSLFGLLKPLNAALYSSFTKELYDKINQVFIPVEQEKTLINDLVDATEKRYDYVDKLVSCFGAKFLLIYQPMVWTENCSPSQSIQRTERTQIVDSSRMHVMRSNFAVPYEALLERLKNKRYFVSFRDALCDRGQAAYQPDGVHLTDYGRKTVAVKMVQLIESLSLK